MSDHKGARLVLEELPSASALIADRGYDSNWLRAALTAKGIAPCIPPTKSRKRPIDYDKTLYRQRQGREPVRQAQGLAPHRDPLRPLRPHLLFSHLPCRQRHLLPQLMGPEPSITVAPCVCCA